jgi:hypothetical protein
MPVSIEALGIDRLSVRERLELIEQIWDSLPEHVNPDEVPQWHLARTCLVSFPPLAGSLARPVGHFPRAFPVGRNSA